MAEIATFGGGNFWGVEDMLKLKYGGLIKTSTGYMSTEQVDDPDYEDLSSGVLGHIQVVQVTFDSSVLSYEQLCRYFFSIHDPT
jgi:methionine-S-sulfoxide reductase